MGAAAWGDIEAAFVGSPGVVVVGDGTEAKGVGVDLATAGGFFIV